MTTKREKILEALLQMGYRPQTDDDGDVFFNYQMKRLYVLVGDEDEAFLQVLLPQFVTLEEGQEAEVLAICNKVTREFKLTKVFMDPSYQTVSASCEFFYTDDESLDRCLHQALRVLSVIRPAFYQAKEDLSR